MYFDNILEEIDEYNTKLDEIKEMLMKKNKSEDDFLLREKTADEDTKNEDPKTNDTSNGTSPQNPTEEKTETKSEKPPPPPPSKFNKFLFNLETFICVLFFISIPFSNQKTLLFIYLKSFIALWRKNMISFNTTKLKQLVKNEFFYNILYVGTIH